MTDDGRALDNPHRLEALAATGLRAESDEALDRFAAMVQRHLGVPVALVSLVDSARQFFPGAVGLRQPWSDDRSTPLSHSICQSVVESGKPLVATDIREIDGLRESLAIPDLDVVAYAGVPLTDADGFVLGSLCAIDGTPRVWTDDDVAALTDLAAACSSELRLRATARAAHEAETRAEHNAERISLTAEASMIVSSTSDLDTALRHLTALLIPRFADWGVVSLVDDDGGVRQLAYQHRDGLYDQMTRYATMLTTSMSSDSPTYQVLHGGPGQVIPLLTDEQIAAASKDPEMLALTYELGCRSFMVAPLTAQGRTLGSIGLTRSSAERPFGPVDLDILSDVAARAGVALDNARLNAEQRRLSEVLQRSLLTELAQPPDLDIAATYRPAAHEAQVGGDWYDAFTTADGATVVVIGDVMGHDITAAASMGQVRSMLRGMGYDRGESPARLLRRVDQAIHGLGMDAIATCVVARIEPVIDAPDVWRVVWSNAGHPPPMIVTPGGVPTVLDDQPDLMLGVAPDADRRDRVARLPAGSTLVMFTDGLVEHRALPLTEGVDRLVGALSALSATGPQDLCDSLAALVSADGDADDDIAIVALRPRAQKK